LSVYKKCIVLSQSFIKSTPNRKSLVWKNLSHSFPKHFFFSLLSLLLLLLCLEIRFLFQRWISNKLLVIQFIFSSEMEFLKDLNCIIKIDVRVVSSFFFKFIIIIFDGWLFRLRSLFGILFAIFSLGLIFLSWSSSILIALLLFFGKSSCFFLLSKLLLFLWTEFIESVNKKLNVIHWFNTKRFSNGINFD